VTRPIIRDTRVGDVPALLAIYRPYVLETAVTFESEPPSEAEFAARIAACQKGWAFLTAELDGQPVGYAYASSHRAREAYQWSVETSVYVGEQAQGRGLGRTLFEALFEKLEHLGFYNDYAWIALTNDASEGLHRALGFEPVGVFRRVGFKFGAWRDVSWWHCAIRDVPNPREGSADGVA
jgi:L-amino acid N-acyltransferase YncA